MESCNSELLGFLHPEPQRKSYVACSTGYQLFKTQVSDRFHLEKEQLERRGMSSMKR